MPTTGVSGVVSEFGPSSAPPNGTTESAPGAAAAARDAVRGERRVTAALDGARPWLPESVTARRTSTATAAGTAIIRNAREFPFRRMGDHTTHGPRREPSQKKRDQFVGTDVISVMSVPNSLPLAGSPG